MGMKEWILRWLGVSALWEETGGLSQHLNQRCDTLEAALESQQDSFLAALAAQRIQIASELRHEFDARIGCVLEASIDASMRVSKAVSGRGDNTLKEYIDSCLNIFETTVNEQLTT